MKEYKREEFEAMSLKELALMLSLGIRGDQHNMLSEVYMEKKLEWESKKRGERR